MKPALIAVFFVFNAIFASGITVPMTPDIGAEARQRAREFLDENPNRRLGFVGNTRSMVPTFDAEYIVVMEPVPFENLKRNQIVVFDAPWAPTTVVHRLYSRFGDSWKTKGDRLENPDPTLLTKENYAGSVIIAAIHKQSGRVVRFF
ncbi:MAG: hypothetical protein QM790_08775 [Nibricoccus sp.]